MPATGTLTFRGTVSGYASGGARSYSATVPVLVGVDAALTLTAFSGFQAVAVPAGATGCVISPPAGNVVGLTLKGITGDTGIPMHLTNPQVLTFASGVTTFGITSASLLGGPVLVEFF